MTIGEAPEAALENLVGTDGHPAEGHVFALESAAGENELATGKNDEASSDASSRSANTNRSLDLDTQVQNSSEMEGKGKDTSRGRTLEREPRSNHPFSGAESRLRDNVAAIEVDLRPVKRRRHDRSRSNTLYKNSSETCAQLEDHLLEPCPEPEVCENVAEVLSSSNGVEDVLRLEQRNTDGAIQSLDASGSTPMSMDCRAECNPHYQPVLLNDNISQSQIYREATNNQQAGTKGHTNNYAAQEQGISSTLAAAQCLPTEIIQQIYSSLSPADFNSARHTCRSWFLSSIESSVLGTMIRRGGWTLATKSEISRNQALIQDNPRGLEWLMSKHVSRECALGSDWTGNGLNDYNMELDDPNPRLAFVHCSTTDFKEVGIHYPGKSTAGSIFTMSSCGKFLMVSNGCLVYVYELNTQPDSETTTSTRGAGSLRPVTSIICPHRVLACSMDTSSARHAIAVLLEGRMGLVCDIIVGRSETTRSDCYLQSECAKSATPCKCSMKHNDLEVDHFFGAACLDRVSFHSSASRSGTTHPSSEARFVFPGIFTTTQYNATEEAAWQAIVRGDIPSFASIGDPNSSAYYPSHARAVKIEEQIRSRPHSEKGPTINSMPLEKGPRSLYRDLCSDDDPPRSVAICPQRRCVAFGCASGIELHWVDALTGQDLNRWFPLTAPSDFLYFLPPRKSVDSAKKLRLISSAARPNERAAIVERAYGIQTRSSPFWERMNWSSDHSEAEGSLTTSRENTGHLRMDTRARIFGSRTDSSDHYRAVPLSDGYHILFTDPVTGLLCLGSDAPVGGPTKLLRKIWFQGPDSHTSPACYIGGSDLTHGVRVIAAYGTGAEQNVWFFSVPSDVFKANYGPLAASRGASLFRPSTAGENHNTEWTNWWPDNGLQEWLTQARDPAACILPRSVWPVKIRGQEIGTCLGVVDLAIDAGPRMTVWAFSATGIAKAWRFNDGTIEGDPGKWLVARDGTVRACDGDGDVEMKDVQSSSSSSLGSDLEDESMSPILQESFDGSASFCISTVYTTRSAHFHREEWTKDVLQRQFLQRQLDGDIIMEDTNGDIVMRDADDEEQRMDRVAYQTWLMSHVRLSRRSFRDYRFAEEEETGITRLDIEIR